MQAFYRFELLAGTSAALLVLQCQILITDILNIIYYDMLRNIVEFVVEVLFAHP